VVARYASNTSVSVEKSRGEIEATLRRYGCVDFAYRTSARSAQIAFQLHERILPHMIVPGGKVFHEVALPAVAQAYETGRMPPLLGGG
jgi:hypothetical protein